MDKLPENIKEQLPKNFDDEWEIIDVKDIKPNDYIAYFPKKRKYESIDDSTKERMTKGGFVSFVPNDDVRKIKEQSMNVIGFRQFNKKWSVGVDNVYFFAKTKKDVQAILAKGKEKANEKRAETRKRKVEIENENLQENIKTAKQMESQQVSKRKKKEIAEAVALSATRSLNDKIVHTQESAVEPQPDSDQNQSKLRNSYAPAKKRLTTKSNKNKLIESVGVEMDSDQSPDESSLPKKKRGPGRPRKENK